MMTHLDFPCGKEKQAIVSLESIHIHDVPCMHIATDYPHMRLDVRRPPNKAKGYMSSGPQSSLELKPGWRNGSAVRLT